MAVDRSAQLLLLLLLAADGLAQGLLLPEHPLLQADVGQHPVAEGADCPVSFPAGQGTVVAGGVTHLPAHS